MRAPAAHAFRSALILALAAVGTPARAQTACQGLPTHAQLKAALTAAVSA